MSSLAINDLNPADVQLVELDEQELSFIIGGHEESHKIEVKPDGTIVITVYKN